MGELLWQLREVGLRGASVPRLGGITLDIGTGVTAVLGCSGAGKTSLLNLLVGFEQPDSGTISCTLPRRADPLPLYWVPQSGGLWPHMTSAQHLAAVAPQLPREAATALLSAFDIEERADAYPYELSQGERSRLAVARALMTGAPALVMDEPFVSVDPARTGKYWSVVRDHLSRAGVSLVFATHSPRAVLAEAQRVICLAEGGLIYEGDVQQLYWRPATPEQADCLGESNWLVPDEARLWLGRQEGKPRCYRPGQLRIERAQTGPLVVRSSRFKGAVAETAVAHEETGAARTFHHRPSSDALRHGDRVVLKVLSLVLLLFLLGCGRSEAPELRFADVEHWAMPPDGASIPAPRSATVGSHDEIVVLDTAGRVLVFDAHGKLVRHWRMPETEMGKPEGVCALKDGRIAVCDTHYHRVVLFDDQGNVTGQFGRAGNGPGEFVYPAGITEDDDGDLYVCEYGANDRIQKFTRDGVFIRSFGSFGSGPADLQRPSGLTWRNGKLYVADAINNRIQVFSEDGDFVGTLQPPNGSLSLHFPYDIAAGPDGALYVAEYGAGRLSKVGLDGRLLGRYGTTGRGPTQFVTPWGMAVDSKMRVRVMDTGNRRIVALNP